LSHVTPGECGRRRCYHQSVVISPRRDPPRRRSPCTRCSKISGSAGLSPPRRRWPWAARRPHAPRR